MSHKKQQTTRVTITIDDNATRENEDDVIIEINGDDDTQITKRAIESISAWAKADGLPGVWAGFNYNRHEAPKPLWATEICRMGDINPDKPIDAPAWAQRLNHQPIVLWGDIAESP